MMDYHEVRKSMQALSQIFDELSTWSAAHGGEEPIVISRLTLEPLKTEGLLVLERLSGAPENKVYTFERTRANLARALAMDDAEFSAWVSSLGISMKNILFMNVLWRALARAWMEDEENRTAVKRFVS